VVKDHSARLERRKIYGSGLFSISLSAPELAAETGPGQFAMVGLEGRIRPYLRRAFSVADIDSGRGEVEFLIKTVGAGTSALETLPLGSPVALLGPLGNRFRTDDLRPGREVALVAGGIGAAPFPLLLRALARASLGAELFFGGRTAAELALRERFAPLLGGRMRLATDDGSLGEKGFITATFRRALERGASYSRLFACGPMPMFRALAQIAGTFGLEAEFSTEAEMGCGFGVCLGCVLPGRDRPYLVSCQEGPILPPSAVDWERVRA
jgi:dihydroorotate dehydrogenase electron transfer subunit